MESGHKSNVLQQSQKPEVGNTIMSSSILTLQNISTSQTEALVFFRTAHVSELRKTSLKQY
jgi:hypothetical protein